MAIRDRDPLWLEDVLSHGIRLEDIAWQAFQAGARVGPAIAEAQRASFIVWWHEREEQGCALPMCANCGYDPSPRVTGAAWITTIAREPPSLNDRLVNSGPRAHAYRKMRREWEWEFRVMRLNQEITPAQARRRVTLTRTYAGRQRERDRDNLIGGMKMIVDAMVSERLIVDDSRSWAEIVYRQEPGAVAGLTVMIEELPELP